ncbi:Hypothetical predicted protein, partial [Paramuricea clavata]
MKLLVLSKKVTACYRTGNFNEARDLLEQYKTILPQVQDRLIFEVMGLYLEAALKRASGDFQELAGLLTEALSKAELIEPGLVTAIVYVFAGTVTDLINSEDPSNKIDSPDVLSIRALEHLQCVKDSSDVLADMKRKAHISLATFCLCCNISGQRIKGNVDNASLGKAKTSIEAVDQSAFEEHPLSGYHDVQRYLVLAIFHYRSSQLSPDQRIRFLGNASRYAKKAECLAKEYQFAEMIEWSKANEALCTEELVSVNSAIQNHANNADHMRNDETGFRPEKRKDAFDTQSSFDERRARRGNYDATRHSDRTIGIEHVDMSNIASFIDIDDITQPASEFQPTPPRSDFVEVKSKRTQKEQRERVYEKEERKQRETKRIMQGAILKPKINKSSQNNTSTALASINVEQKRVVSLMLVKPGSPPPPPINAWTKPLSITPAKPPNEASAELPRITQPDPLAVERGKPLRTDDMRLKDDTKDNGEPKSQPGMDKPKEQNDGRPRSTSRSRDVNKTQKAKLQVKNEKSQNSDKNRDQNKERNSQQPQRDSRTPSGRQEQQYTAPGQSE